MSTDKVCGRCNKSKPVGEFPVCRRNPDGLYYCCKPCKVEAMRETKARKGWVRKRRSKAYCPDHKVCPGCERDLSLDEFWADHARFDGRQAYCKTCSPQVQRRWIKKSGWKQKSKPYDASARAAQRTYRKKNPDRRRESQQAWRAKNTEHCREYERQRAEKNPDGIKAKNKAYFARKDAAEGSFTPKEWQAKCQEYGNLCAYCRQPRSLTRHHVVPLIKGGSNWISNIVPACRSCNSKVGTKTVHPEARDGVGISTAG